MNQQFEIYDIIDESKPGISDEKWIELNRVETALSKLSMGFKSTSRLENIPQTIPKQKVRETPKVGRNEPCSCGSGKKYKSCCLKVINGI